MRYGLAADQTALIEEPLVLTMELLKGIVGQHQRFGLIGDTEHECVASANGSRRWCYQLVVGHGFIKLFGFELIDAMAECGIHHHRYGDVGMLGHERQNGVIQLSETRSRTALGRNVRTVDHHMGRSGVLRHISCLCPVMVDHRTGGAPRVLRGVQLISASPPSCMCNSASPRVVSVYICWCQSADLMPRRLT